jgi:hypothetical protein
MKRPIWLIEDIKYAPQESLAYFQKRQAPLDKEKLDNILKRIKENGKTTEET